MCACPHPSTDEETKTYSNGITGPKAVLESTCMNKFYFRPWLHSIGCDSYSELWHATGYDILNYTCSELWHASRWHAAHSQGIPHLGIILLLFPGVLPTAINFDYQGCLWQSLNWLLEHISIKWKDICSVWAFMLVAEFLIPLSSVATSIFIHWVLITQGFSNTDMSNLI